MRVIIPFAAATLLCIALPCVLPLEAGIIPTEKFDPQTSQAFDNYVTEFEKGPAAEFVSQDRMWIDTQTGQQKSTYESGKPIMQWDSGRDVPNGHIFHSIGAIRVEGATAEQVRRAMQDYNNYKKAYAPEVAESSATREPDSVAADEHFKASMRLTQSTLWIDVAYDGLYDVHYLRIDPKRFQIRSRSMSIRELRDYGDPGKGAYPPDEAHGFIWRTNTYWNVRERNGGVDMEVNNITVSRAIPSGIGWFTNRKSKEALEKLLTKTRAAVLAHSVRPG